MRYTTYISSAILLFTIDPTTAQFSNESSARSACIPTRIYHPNKEELWWRKNIDRVASSSQDWHHGCKSLKKQKKVINTWLKLWKQREVAMTLDRLSTVDKLLETKGLNIPYFEIRNTCDNRESIRVPIEPLMGFLRHPLLICLSDDIKKYRVNKDYMFPSHALEIVPKLIDDKTKMRRGRAYFFDLGCSMYDDGFGGASQSWFVETYKKRGIEFDRILAWEAQGLDPNKLFQGYPAEVIDVLSYFNVPADPDPNGKENPLRILSDLCVPADFVVVKIDIDNAPVESAFIKQLLQSPHLLQLIDEFYFEHHVERNPMEFYGWNKSVRNGMRNKYDFGFNNLSFTPSIMSSRSGLDYTSGPVVRADNDITASYEIFHTLRQYGIRAHSWV